MRSLLKTHALRKIDMNSVIVYQHPLHFEVGLLTIFLVFEFDECILKAFTRAFISNDFAGYYGPETAEDGIQVLVCGVKFVSRNSKTARRLSV